MCILLLVANLRLIATNIRKYGLSTIVPSICTLSDIANAPRLTGTISLVRKSEQELECRPGRGMLRSDSGSRMRPWGVAVGSGNRLPESLLA